MQAEDQAEGIDIGTRLRAVRVAQRLSQRELARRSGVTNGMISQIEQNNSSPSVSSLKRILDAIPMTLGAFFSEDFTDQQKVFFRKDELREINPGRVFRNGATDAATISLRQVGTVQNRAIQMLHECYAPGADTGAELYTHDAEEAGIVIEGEIEITVGDETVVLGPGDAYLFDSRVPHRFRNIGNVECTLVSACTPPSF